VVANLGDFKGLLPVRKRPFWWNFSEISGIFCGFLLKNVEFLGEFIRARVGNPVIGGHPCTHTANENFYYSQI
jgi:hypothetical protein